MLLLDTNRKLYMGSPMTLSHFDIERSKSRSVRFEALYPVKQKLRPHVTIKH